MFTYKKQIVLYIMLLFLMLIMMPQKTYAAGASVQFTSTSLNYKVGDEFAVICSVRSSDPFSTARLSLIYDTDVLEFVRGGNKVTGGNGEIIIDSSYEDKSVKKMTFSLAFRAKKIGTSSLELNDNSIVLDKDEEDLSISSNELVFEVKDPDENPDEPIKTVDFDALMAAVDKSFPEDDLNSNTKLKSLSCACVSMKPKFSPTLEKYRLKVNCRTDKLYIDFKTSNSKQRVKIKNNLDFMPGENKVKVVVYAESGDTRTYEFTVVKETETETSVREREEAGKRGFAFRVFTENGKTYIQNDYQFQVVDIKDENVLPTGYVKSVVEVGGQNVSAYTIANDLDNNYLLMYLKTASTKPKLYQFDREEKTLQRYTGTMTKKINEGGNVAEKLPQISNAWLYMVIVILAVAVLGLLIGITNMALKNRIGKGKRELDDMDF